MQSFPEGPKGTLNRTFTTHHHIHTLYVKWMPFIHLKLKREEVGLQFKENEDDVK